MTLTDLARIIWLGLRFKPKSVVLAPPVQDPILPGQLWVLKGDDGSPWPIGDCPPVRILDARGGWVRYDMGRIFPDNRMEEGSFRHCYRKIEVERRSG